MLTIFAEALPMFATITLANVSLNDNGAPVKVADVDRACDSCARWIVSCGSATNESELTRELDILRGTYLELCGLRLSRKNTRAEQRQVATMERIREYMVDANARLAAYRSGL